jgi:hypothetical protein
LIQSHAVSSLQLRPDARQSGIRRRDLDITILCALARYSLASRIEPHDPHVDTLEELGLGQPHPVRRVPGDDRIQLGNQSRVLNQIGARYHRGHQPEVNESAHEDLSHPGQSLSQRDRIAQPCARTTPADTQGRGYFSNDVLVAVDGPVQPIDIVLWRAARVQLADSGQLSRAHRVLVARCNGDGSHHAGIDHVNKRRTDLR